MEQDSLGLGIDLLRYLRAVSVRESAVLAKLRAETAERDKTNLQIMPEQAAFMQMVARLMEVRTVLEVGTFTGYSTLALAEVMPETGRIITCDVSEEWTAVARRYWREAGVEAKISLEIGEAADTLNTLISGGHAGRFDLSFIDADKENYDTYYEQSLKLVRPGGLILIDNTLWYRQVIDPQANDPDTAALKALNQKLYEDERITLCMLPVGDGMTMARKRQGSN